MISVSRYEEPAKSIVLVLDAIRRFEWNKTTKEMTIFYTDGIVEVFTGDVAKAMRWETTEHSPDRVHSWQSNGSPEV
jgi:hypothetical protein